MFTWGFEDKDTVCQLGTQEILNKLPTIIIIIIITITTLIQFGDDGIERTLVRPQGSSGRSDR